MLSYRNLGLEISYLLWQIYVHLVKGSMVVEHTPHNQEVVWFESRRVLGLFLLLLLSFPTFLQQRSVLNQVPQGGASLAVCCEIK